MKASTSPAQCVCGLSLLRRLASFVCVEGVVLLMALFSRLDGSLCARVMSLPRP